MPVRAVAVGVGDGGRIADPEDADLDRAGVEPLDEHRLVVLGEVLGKIGVAVDEAHGSAALALVGLADNGVTGE